MTSFPPSPFMERDRSPVHENSDRGSLTRDKNRWLPPNFVFHCLPVVRCHRTWIRVQTSQKRRRRWGGGSCSWRRSALCDLRSSFQDYPFLSNVKRLHIGYKSFTHDFDSIIRLANTFGELVKSVGPLDALSIYDCDARVFLAPFLHLQGFDNTEQPIVYPPIKELKIHHPSERHDDECLTTIVALAKSQHVRGMPFEHLKLRMASLPGGAVRRLRPWVGAVDCYGTGSIFCPRGGGALAGSWKVCLFVHMENGL